MMKVSNKKTGTYMQAVYLQPQKIGHVAEEHVGNAT
jgi:hypothetical protein